MKNFLFCILVGFCLHIDSFAHAESVHFALSLNLYSETHSLTDLIGTQGSQLCGPVSATHAFNFLKYKHSPPFSSLLTFPDMDQDGTANTYRDQIRYFYQTCKTDRETGTHYRDLVTCMQDYQNQSRLGTWDYMIGPHANIAPPNASLADVQHVIQVSDVRYFVSNQAAVIMTVGWYQLDPSSLTYSRVGGHIFNVYGYDYNEASGENQINLDVVNSFVDYGNRPSDQLFDSVSMTHVPNDGTHYPAETAYQITGTGFQFSQKGLVEDLIVAFPVAPGATAQKFLLFH